MFEQLFTSMKELLSDISSRYGAATGEDKIQLDEQLTMLKKMSDEYMELWLDFEEALAAFYLQVPPQEAKQTVNKLDMRFIKAQGYYKLSMYKQAIDELEAVVKQQPDDLHARIYLAMGYMRLGQEGDAYPHFSIILPLTENVQLKAISLNAMGCIQVKKRNIHKAMEYFRLAYELDPELLSEPARHIGVKPLSQQRLP